MQVIEDGEDVEALSKLGPTSNFDFLEISKNPLFAIVS